MAVTATLTPKFIPFGGTEDPRLSTGYFIGATTVTGDATGGLSTITVALPSNLLMKLFAASFDADGAAADGVVLIEIRTYIDPATLITFATSRLLRRQAAANRSPLDNYGVTEFPFLIGSGASGPDIRFIKNNDNTVVDRAAIYGIYWDPTALRKATGPAPLVFAVMV